MFRILSVFVLTIALISPAWAVTQWNASMVPTFVGETASSFPAEVYSQWGILQTLLQNYRQGYALIYNNSTTLSIGAGEVSGWNGSASYFLQNTGSQTATVANLDTGSSFSSSTTYYVYAGSSSSTQGTATISISLNNTTPSNLTYYQQLGSFTTTSSGGIGEIVDLSVLSRLGTWSPALSINTIYQASTDGIVTVSANGGANINVTGYTDSNPTPVTARAENAIGANGSNEATITFPVKKGDYYQVTSNGSLAIYYFIPLGQ